MATNIEYRCSICALPLEKGDEIEQGTHFECLKAEELYFASNAVDPTDPSHYHFDIQPIDYMRGMMSRGEFRAYCQGNVIKYVSRYKDKNGLEDLRKAGVYLQWMVDTYGA